MNKSPSATSPAGPAVTQLPQPTAAASLYFPPPTGEWEKTTPQQAGFTASGLENIVAVARDNKTATFMMLSGGRILSESYFGPASATFSVDVASVQKSIVSTLIGIARERSLLTLSDPVSKYLSAGWSKGNPAHEAAITIEQLMTHSSGLDPNTLRSVAAPGSKFDYNTPAYQKLRPLLEKAAGQDISVLTHTWIFDKIGPPDATKWQLRPGEEDATGAATWGLNMNAREMARFGLLAQRKGQWAGTPVVRAAWFDEAWASSKLQADYGLLWWLMGKGRVREPGVPRDWVAALGAKDQKIYVVPSMDLVLTRQGLAAGEESENFSNFDTVLFKAIAGARA